MTAIAVIVVTVIECYCDNVKGNSDDSDIIFITVISINIYPIVVTTHPHIVILYIGLYYYAYYYSPSHFMTATQYVILIIVNAKILDYYSCYLLPTMTSTTISSLLY